MLLAKMGLKLQTLGKVLNYLLYGTADKKDYVSNIKKIRESNLKLLQLTSLSFALIQFLILVIAYFLDVFPRSITFYIAICILSFLIFIISKTLIPKKDFLTLFVFYFFITCMQIFTTYIGLFEQPYNLSVIFCVLMFAFPVIIFDRPIRLTVIICIELTIFCIFTISKKEYKIATVDCLNAIVSSCAGMAIFFYLTRIKLHEIIQNDLIAKERDTDSVTKLYNKSATERHIAKAIKEHPEGGAFLILDLDEFKFINDTYGHKTGDDILCGIGFCVFSIFSNKDICGRFGGDEFIIYMVGEKDKEVISRYTQRLQSFIQHEIVLADSSKTVNCSIGISIFPTDGENYTNLLIKADKALYHAKSSGKNKFCFSDELD